MAKLGGKSYPPGGSFHGGPGAPFVGHGGFYGSVVPTWQGGAKPPTKPPKHYLVRARHAKNAKRAG